VEIIKWFVKVGDKIQAFDRVCEVQSDKATVEISSRYDGEVIKIYTEVGGIANVGKPLIDLLKPADAAAPGAAPAAEKAPSAPGLPVPHLARTQLDGLQGGLMHVCIVRVGARQHSRETDGGAGRRCTHFRAEQVNVSHKIATPRRPLGQHLYRGRRIRHFPGVTASA
jgi:pyruvate/2-oxoglutarate dehydrogenase complex dihydrolipoamide acyltransferase (E2) component